jgi:hypothetical protein
LLVSEVRGGHSKPPSRKLAAWQTHLFANSLGKKSAFRCGIRVIIRHRGGLRAQILREGTIASATSSTSRPMHTGWIAVMQICRIPRANFKLIPHRGGQARERNSQMPKPLFCLSRTPYPNFPVRPLLGRPMMYGRSYPQVRCSTTCHVAVKLSFSTLRS